MNQKEKWLIFAFLVILYFVLVNIAALQLATLAQSTVVITFWGVLHVLGVVGFVRAATLIEKKRN